MPDAVRGTGIHKILADYVDDGFSPEEAVRKAEALPDYIDLVHPLAVQEADRYVRQATRRLEQKILPEWLKELAEPGPPADTKSAPKDRKPDLVNGRAPRATRTTPVITPDPKVSLLATLPEARRSLVMKFFVLPDGERVLWLKATVTEHRARADWQRKRGLSYLSDARLHEVAADQIEASGVTCLEDLILLGARS